MPSSKNFDKLRNSARIPGFKRKNGSNKKQSPFMAALKTAGVYLLIGLAALIFFAGAFGGGKTGQTVPISQVVQDVKDGKISKIEVEGDQVTATYKEGNRIVTARKEGGESIYQVLKDSGVDPGTVSINVVDTSWQQNWIQLLGNLLPVVLLGGLLLMMLRQARDAGSNIFAFGQSRARLFTKDQPQVKFADVAGVDEAKKELAEVVEFLKTPEKFRALGARIPKGVLLVGPSGVGKTLLARAVAGEAGVPFFSIAGSEFMEMLVGVGAARVRDMFGQAKKSAPAIIFIDEIESIGRQRGTGFSGGHDEREQTLNQILVEMDGFAPNEQVIVIGATNRPDLLDAALIRPGRFDRRVTLGLPDLEERKAIIKLHMGNKPFSQDVSIERLARRTVGFSGADIANMINEAAILAAREDKQEIDNIDLEEAATKEKLGPKRKRMQSEADRKLSAYHEAGHAIVGHFLPNVDPVHRISIVSRGMSGGHTMFPPTEDRSNETKHRLVEQISAALGGQAAERVVFGDVSTGALSDIQVATSIARDMVTQYGMSDLGPINLQSQAVFGMWRNPDEAKEMSEELHAQVDREVKKILDAAFGQASALIKKYRVRLDKVARKLLDKETLEADEFEKIVGKKVAL